MQKNNRLFFLDYLRIFAFISVLIGHKFQNTITSLSNDQSLHAIISDSFYLLSKFTEFGGAGVVVFFMVSGYIISASTRESSASSFLIKRFFRIYPLYIFAVFLEIAFIYISTGNIKTSFTDLIATITLTGDIFNTPYALSGVEWTLRVEILFYFLIAFAQRIKLLENGKNTVYAMISIAVFMNFFPIPDAEGWATGYTSIYMPFIFIGVCFYIYENKQEINISHLIAYTSMLYAIHLISLSENNPALKNSYFSAIAVAIFTLAWIFRNYFSHSRISLIISSLTYSVYLFHNWIWEYLYSFSNNLITPPWAVSLSTVILLFFICFLFHILIEKPFIKLGKYMTKKNFTSEKSASYALS